MKTILRAYKYGLRPTAAQRVLLEKHFGCARYIYNYFLSEKEKQYKETGKSDSYFSMCAKLTELKKDESHEWLNEIPTTALRISMQGLDNAYKKFFKKQGKYPRYKSKKKSKNTFTVEGKLKLKDGRIYIPRFKEGIICVVHREFTGEIRRMTISKDSIGRYHVSVLVKQEYQPSLKTEAVCGIDLGLKDLAITSDGVRYENNGTLKENEIKLRKAQKHLSRKQKGSNSFDRQKRKVAKIHRKVANTRADILHKVTHHIVEKYDVICLENLNVAGMMKNRRIAKAISDVSWHKFVTMLEYKAAWNDKQIVKIGRFFPSTKTCSICGDVNHNLKLSDRDWTCSNGHYLDRDINAANNILKEGLRILSEGAADYTGGATVRPGFLAQAMKPEAFNFKGYITTGC